MPRAVARTSDPVPLQSAQRLFAGSLSSSFNSFSALAAGVNDDIGAVGFAASPAQTRSWPPHGSVTQPHARTRRKARRGAPREARRDKADDGGWLFFYQKS